jgi:hypothetical protein
LVNNRLRALFAVAVGVVGASHPNPAGKIAALFTVDTHDMVERNHGNPQDMSKQLTVIENNAIVNMSETRAELNLIGANARNLSRQGAELQPIKPDMLAGLPVAEIIETCELLFACVLAYEGAQVALARAEHAADAVAIVKARMQAGRAEGTVCALLHGPTAWLLYHAMDRAPIAFYELASASPGLQIIDRLQAALTGQTPPALL